MKIISKPRWGERVVAPGNSLTRDFQVFFDDLEEQLNDKVLGDQVQLPSYTVATLPSASRAGGWIFVSDEVGGPVPAFSDGVNWLRCTDRAIVS